MKKPTRGSRLTELPSVNTNCFLRSRMALSTQYTCTYIRNVGELLHCTACAPWTQAHSNGRSSHINKPGRQLSRSEECHLLGAHRQHVQVDPVELIKATPKAALGETLIDLAHALVVHLVRAVEHHHILTQGVTKILHQHPSRSAAVSMYALLGNQRNCAAAKQGAS